MKKRHIRCANGCGCGSGYFDTFQQAAEKHESDMWAYEMPHDYSPVEIDDKTGKETRLDKNTGRPLHENTMKKSELKALIREVIEELNEPHAFSIAFKTLFTGPNGFKKEHDHKIEAFPAKSREDLPRAVQAWLDKQVKDAEARGKTGLTWKLLPNSFQVFDQVH